MVVEEGPDEVAGGRRPPCSMARWTARMWLAKVVDAERVIDDVVDGDRGDA